MVSHGSTRVFHNSGCTRSSVTTIVPMAIEPVLTAAILHFKKYHLRKRYIFSQSLLTDIISDPKIWGQSVTPASHFRAVAMFLLLIAGYLHTASW